MLESLFFLFVLLLIPIAIAIVALIIIGDMIVSNYETNDVKQGLLALLPSVLYMLFIFVANRPVSFKIAGHDITFVILFVSGCISIAGAVLARNVAKKFSANYINVILNITLSIFFFLIFVLDVCR